VTREAGFVHRNNILEKVEEGPQPGEGNAQKRRVTCNPSGLNEPGGFPHSKFWTSRAGGFWKKYDVPARAPLVSLFQPIKVSPGCTWRVILGAFWAYPAGQMHFSVHLPWLAAIRQDPGNVSGPDQRLLVLNMMSKSFR